MQRIWNHPCNRREVDDLAIFFMADLHRFNQLRNYADPELLSWCGASVRKHQNWGGIACDAHHFCNNLLRTVRKL